MIEISDVTKRYGPTVAVDRLSFEVRPGEVTGFLGPNGAGKSTTMRMVVGLDAPTSGRVAVDGHASTASTPRASSGSAGFCDPLAAEGRSILVSSHLMSEMAQTADRLVVIGRGRLIAEGTVDDLVRRSSNGYVRVGAAEPERLRRLLTDGGADVSAQVDGTLVVTGMEARDVGVLAAAEAVTLYELSPHSASLEEAFFELTRDATDAAGTTSSQVSGCCSTRRSSA